MRFTVKNTSSQTFWFSKCSYLHLQRWTECLANIKGRKENPNRVDKYGNSFLECNSISCIGFFPWEPTSRVVSRGWPPVMFVLLLALAVPCSSLFAASALGRVWQCRAPHGVSQLLGESAVASIIFSKPGLQKPYITSCSLTSHSALQLSPQCWKLWPYISDPSCHQGMCRQHVQLSIYYSILVSPIS